MHEQPRALLIDPSRPDFRESLEALQPTTGFCIFVDIVGSTAMKDSSVKSWIAYISNHFANIRTFLHSFGPLKAIGDELMYFIPDSQLQETGRTALSIFSGLASIAREPDRRMFKDAKIAVAYCLDAYAITFVPGSVDYYGKDIDLTARLLTKADSREIVMNEPFREGLMCDYEATGNKEQFPEVIQITGPTHERFRGFDHYVPIYTLPDRKEEDRR